ncbi:DUF1684 domain-containing protein [Kineosporiaceae bacterium SCSIO 59966]|nr:DUF1684 domain-containing protein [Kineosporiaceae bacterium SCSIO 59966]
MTSELDVLDWRRQVSTLYANVRRQAAGDPAAAHATWRAGRDELFAHHPASPLLLPDRHTFTGLPVADYDPAFRFVVPVRTDTATESFEYPTGTDGIVPFHRVGTVELPGLGPLAVWWLDSYGGGLFLPLRDATSGTSSFGGGRYLLDTVKGADLGGSPDALVVDLNFAYNPSCAYDPAWSCPLAPPANHLATPVPVGELTPP